MCVLCVLVCLCLCVCMFAWVWMFVCVSLYVPHCVYTVHDTVGVFVMALHNSSVSLVCNPLYACVRVWMWVLYGCVGVCHRVATDGVWVYHSTVYQYI